MGLLAAMFGVALFACAPAAAPPKTEPVAPLATEAVRAESVDAKDCAARGGVVERGGRMQQERCVVAYADAGKTCRNDADCTARCIYDIDARGPSPNTGPITGECQRTEVQFGCYSEVDGGKLVSTICVD